MCHTVCIGDTPRARISQLSQLQGDTSRKDDTNREKSFILPETGTTQYFRYERDSEEMYRITPIDGTPPYLVSASFLRITLGSARIDNFQQAELLNAYPILMQEMFTKAMAQAYPDGTTEYEEPFSPQAFIDTNGTQLLLTQDPVAVPYVRVRFTSDTGKSGEFSVARSVVEQMLANSQLTDDQLLRGLQTFPLRLPEAARSRNFTHLSAVELASIIQQDPELRRHEFIRMAQPAGEALVQPTFEAFRRQRKTRLSPSNASGASAVAKSQPKAHTSEPLFPLLTAHHTAEQPHALTGGSQRVAPSSQTSSLASPEPKSVRSVWPSVVRYGLYIIALSLFVVGIIAFVSSRLSRV